MEKKELAAGGTTVVFVLLRGQCLVAWSGADLASLGSNVCLVCLFAIEYLLKCFTELDS